MDNIVFTKKQFALTDEALLETTRMVLDLTPDINAGMDEDDKVNWCKQYQSIVGQHLNARRGYCLDRTRKSIVEWRTDIEPSTTRINNFPTPEDVMRCAKRDVDLTLPQDYNPETDGDLLAATKDGKLFDWYWNNLLAKNCGDKVWAPSVRHYDTISDAVHWNQSK